MPHSNMTYSSACLLMLAALSAHEANGQAPISINRRGKGQAANVFHEDFLWKNTPKDADNDFYGKLDMCGGMCCRILYWFPFYVMPFNGALCGKFIINYFLCLMVILFPSCLLHAKRQKYYGLSAGMIMNMRNGVLIPYVGRTKRP